MSAVRAVGRLDVARARKLTTELQGALDLALDLLHQVYAGEAWRVLGYATWGAYCAAELPQLAILGKGLPEPERVAVVTDLRGKGMSLRAIGEPLGLAPNTVRAAANAGGVQLAEVVSIDGSVRAATAGTPARRRRRVPLTDRIITAVVAAGPGGVTAQDVAREVNQPRHLVSPALCRLTEAGRLAYLRPERRGQFGRYVAGDPR